MAATSASWGYSGLEGKLWYLIAWVFPMRLFQKSLEVVSVLPIKVCFEYLNIIAS